MVATLSATLCASPSVASAATYQHPSGATFIYPDSWQAAPMAENVLVAPSGASKDAQGVPDELVLLGAEGVGELTNLADPNVIAFFDQGATALLPGAKRNTPPSVQGSVAELHYADTNGGSLRVQYRFEAGLGLYAAHRVVGGAGGNVAAADTIFSSFALNLQSDPALLGVWSRSRTEMSDVSYSADGGASYASSHSRTTYEFQADQSVRFYNSASVYGQAEGGGGSTTISSAGEDNDPDIGTYTVQEDMLTILWTEGDAVTLTYSVFETSDGPALKMVLGNDKPRFYRRQ